MYVLATAPLSAKENVLALSFGRGVLRLTAHELIIRPDAASITIPDDVSYHRTMTYRAVPLIALIGDVTKLGFDTIEARASDGFVSQIPASLVMQGASGGSVAGSRSRTPKRRGRTFRTGKRALDHFISFGNIRNERASAVSNGRTRSWR
jgi:hypothetical protein